MSWKVSSSRAGELVDAGPTCTWLEQRRDGDVRDVVDVHDRLA